MEQLGSWVPGRAKETILPHKREARGSIRERLTDVSLLALKMEEGTMSQGIQAASRD